MGLSMFIKAIAPDPFELTFRKFKINMISIAFHRRKHGSSLPTDFVIYMMTYIFEEDAPKWNHSYYVFYLPAQMH